MSHRGGNEALMLFRAMRRRPKLPQQIGENGNATLNRQVDGKWWEDGNLCFVPNTRETQSLKIFSRCAMSKVMNRPRYMIKK